MSLKQSATTNVISENIPVSLIIHTLELMWICMNHIESLPELIVRSFPLVVVATPSRHGEPCWWNSRAVPFSWTQHLSNTVKTYLQQTETPPAIVQSCFSVTELVVVITFPATCLVSRRGRLWRDTSGLFLFFFFFVPSWHYKAAGLGALTDQVIYFLFLDCSVEVCECACCGPGPRMNF